MSSRKTKEKKIHSRKTRSPTSSETRLNDDLLSLASSIQSKIDDRFSDNVFSDDGSRNQRGKFKTVCKSPSFKQTKLSFQPSTAITAMRNPSPNRNQTKSRKKETAKTARRAIHITVSSSSSDEEEITSRKISDGEETNSSKTSDDVDTNSRKTSDDEEINSRKISHGSSKTIPSLSDVFAVSSCTSSAETDDGEVKATDSGSCNDGDDDKVEAADRSGNSSDYRSSSSSPVRMTHDISNSGDEHQDEVSYSDGEGDEEHQPKHRFNPRGHHEKIGITDLPTVNFDDLDPEDMELFLITAPSELSIEELYGMDVVLDDGRKVTTTIGHQKEQSRRKSKSKDNERNNDNYEVVSFGDGAVQDGHIIPLCRTGEDLISGPAIIKRLQVVKKVEFPPEIDDPVPDIQPIEIPDTLKLRYRPFGAGLTDTQRVAQMKYLNTRAAELKAISELEVPRDAGNLDTSLQSKKKKKRKLSESESQVHAPQKKIKINLSPNNFGRRTEVKCKKRKQNDSLCATDSDSIVVTPKRKKLGSTAIESTPVLEDSGYINDSFTKSVKKKKKKRNSVDALPPDVSRNQNTANSPVSSPKPKQRGDGLQVTDNTLSDSSSKKKKKKNKLRDLTGFEDQNVTGNDSLTNFSTSINEVNNNNMSLNDTGTFLNDSKKKKKKKKDKFRDVTEIEKTVVSTDDYSLTNFSTSISEVNNNVSLNDTDSFLNDSKKKKKKKKDKARSVSKFEEPSVTGVDTLIKANISFNKSIQDVSLNDMSSILSGSAEKRKKKKDKGVHGNVTGFEKVNVTGGDSLNNSNVSFTKATVDLSLDDTSSMLSHSSKKKKKRKDKVADVTGSEEPTVAHDDSLINSNVGFTKASGEISLNDPGTMSGDNSKKKRKKKDKFRDVTEIEKTFVSTDDDSYINSYIRFINERGDASQNESMNDSHTIDEKRSKKKKKLKDRDKSSEETVNGKPSDIGSTGFMNDSSGNTPKVQKKKKRLLNIDAAYLESNEPIIDVSLDITHANDGDQSSIKAKKKKEKILSKSGGKSDIAHMSHLNLAISALENLNTKKSKKKNRTSVGDNSFVLDTSLQDTATDKDFNDNIISPGMKHKQKKLKKSNLSEMSVSKSLNETDLVQQISKTDISGFSDFDEVSLNSSKHKKKKKKHKGQHD